jgi:hypothetical protein
MAKVMRQVAVNCHAACRHKQPPNRAGTATVEFAVTAPLLFLVLFGVVEFGRAMMVQQTLVSASREACRVAVLDGKTKGDAESRITPMLSSAGITDYTITFSPDPPSSAKVGDPVIVTVQVPFNKVTWLPAPQFLRDTTLRESTTLSREGAH